MSGWEGLHAEVRRGVGVLVKKIAHPAQHIGQVGRQAVQFGDFGRRGSEMQRIAPRNVVQRLHAKPVANQIEPFVAGIEQSEGEHAVAAREGFRAPLFERLQEHFRVAGALEAMPQGDKLSPQLDVIVDFPVEHYARAPVNVPHGLIAGWGEIDDRQAVVAEHDATAAALDRLHGMKVRPATLLAVDNPLDVRPKRRRWLQRENARYAAHKSITVIISRES